MYKCEKCGASFETPDYYCDDPSPTGVALPSGCYTYDICPNCGSEDIDKAVVCAGCEEAHFELNGGDLCDDCKALFAAEIAHIQSRFGLNDEMLYEAITEYLDERERG